MIGKLVKAVHYEYNAATPAFCFMNHKNQPFSSLRINPASGHGSWLRYFAAALCLGVAQGQEQVLLDYWWVYSDEPAPVADNSQVLRVSGEKGEEYVAALQPSDYKEMADSARSIIGRSMRSEVVALASQYISEGMSSSAAYERAWTTVYRRRVLSGEASPESARMRELMHRVSSSETLDGFTPGELLLALHAFLADEKRMQTEEGQQLLEKIATRLRAMGYTRKRQKLERRDEMMSLFVDALQHGMNAFAAFRDALFKVNRDKIMRHSLMGYRAPWGAGLSGHTLYHQAPKSRYRTVSSGNTNPKLLFQPVQTGSLNKKGFNQPVVENNSDPKGPAEDESAATGDSENPLLAQSPKNSETKEETEEKEEVSFSNFTQSNVVPGVPEGFAPTGRFARTFAMARSVAPAADYSYTWDGTASSNIWRADGSAENSGWGTQSATSGQPGVYENGYAVTFNDTSSSRDVILVGTVAPGNEIAVNADSANGTYAGSSPARTLKYGYAVTGAGSIADYTDRDGNLLARTSITNAGSALLVLDTENSFSGGIRLESGASVYLGRDYAAGTGTITMGDNSSLIVNYRSSDLSWRSPSLSNALVVNGAVRISTGLATFGEDRLPCDWRTLTLSGGVSGSGELALYGYSYMVKPTLYEDRSITYNYVSAFAINEKNAVSGGSAPKRFTGTVFLKNEFNHRADGAKEVNVDKDKFVGGAVQLTLVDDVFSEATLNMVRDKTKEGERDAVGSNAGPFGNIGPSMTSDNILVLSDNTQICIGALEAGFIGGAFTMSYKDGGNYTPYTGYVSEGGNKGEYGQEHERWNVRVVTDGYTNLVLDDDDTVEAHAFAGSMGFAHSYTTSAQAYIHAPLLTGKNINNATYATEPTNPGGGSLGLEALSLEKRGKATQYIHSANLQNLSVLGGVVGFNHLSLAGNLVMRSGTDLAMSAATNAATGWADLSETSWASTDVLTIAPGKQMLVVSDSSQSAAITGSLTMSAGNTDVSGSMLSFDIETLSPSADENLPHLTVSGTLTLQKDTPVSVSIGDAGFLAAAGTSEYYLAKASTLSVMDGDKKGTFQIQLVPLGYGYYGSVYVDGQYLMMKVGGDPRRTWSGVNDVEEDHEDYEWYMTAYTDKEIKDKKIYFEKTDTRWKEKFVFKGAQVVLFGNLYEPLGWSSALNQDSSDTVKVDGNILHLGTLVEETLEGKKDPSAFSINGVSVAIGEGVDRAEGYQAVKIVGDVAPMSVVINSSYTKDTVQDDGVTDSKLEEDATNYYFYGEGSIKDASKEDFTITGFDQNWLTNVRKMGKGTAVIATDNSYSGGTVIEGGRLVMQHANALGSGVVDMQNSSKDGKNIPMLQGDFKDAAKPDDSVYQGEGMSTTSIHNTVNVLLHSGAHGGQDTQREDARIANAYDSKLVLETLQGELGTVLTLYGFSLADDDPLGMYSYAVFKVLNPSGFYGTIRMDGNLLNAAEGAPGGKVQMEIMSTTKSADGFDWLHTTVDLSVSKDTGTERTVLALDALGTSGAASVQTAQVDALNGGGNGGARINSSVLSMSLEKTVTLELLGMNHGDYDGVLGFGDFQKTVDYGTADGVAIGKQTHHYGGRDTAGEMNVRKLGNSTQSVNSAWLNRLVVGYREGVGRETMDSDGEVATQGGTFVVDEALVVSEVKIADGMHVFVGKPEHAFVHALTVGAGGILAMAETEDNADSFDKIGAGIPLRTEEYVADNGDILTREVGPSAFILFADGATIAANGDWWTKYSRTEKLSEENVYREVGIDIETGATVTINTHNFTVDASITSSHEDYDKSYVIQLLGAMAGRDVNLIFNNELISAAAQEKEIASYSAVEEGYAGLTGVEIGHVAIRDLHQFTGNITVEDMTVLQIAESNSTASDATADMDITVTGDNAAVQFVDAVTDQYINNVQLEQGAHVLLGGALQSSRTAWKSIDQTQVEVDITNREAATPGSLSNWDMVKDAAASSISMGGTSAAPSEAVGVHISTKATEEEYDALKLSNVELVGSIVELHAECQLDITEAVLVDFRSEIQGVDVNYSAGTVNPKVGPSAAVGLNDTVMTKEVTTSAQTLVQMTFDESKRETFAVGRGKVMVLQTNQFAGVDVAGEGLTIELHEDWNVWVEQGTSYVAIQMGGGSGQFLYEVDNDTADSSFGNLIGSQFVLRDKNGNDISSLWVTSTEVSAALDEKVSEHMLYFLVPVPEPATATLSLLALAALCARRRRK